MFRYLVESGHYLTIQRLICITGGNGAREIEVIHLYIDYNKLNSITVRDAFPLP